jgi:hypothetical protein
MEHCLLSSQHLLSLLTNFQHFRNQKINYCVGFEVLRWYNQSVNNGLKLFLVRGISSALKMEATRSSETSVYNKLTRRHIPDDGILH